VHMHLIRADGHDSSEYECKRTKVKCKMFGRPTQRVKE
jgi:hypothetical protein